MFGKVCEGRGRVQLYRISQLGRTAKGFSVRRDRRRKDGIIKNTKARQAREDVLSRTRGSRQGEVNLLSLPPLSLGGHIHKILIFIKYS